MYPEFLSLDRDFTEYSKSKYVIIPVPYDGTSTYGKGADKGPSALIEASDQLEYYDVETGLEACFMGIHVDRRPFGFAPDASGVRKMAEEVEERTASVIRDRKIPVVIGGEHSVSIGAVFAAAGEYVNLTVLQIDAHSDMRDSYMGSRYNHACVMARIMEKASVLQAGIRSTAKEELVRIDRGRIWFDHEIHDSSDWIARLTEKINGPVYITFDLDGLDPAVMSATGTPQPGGLSWRETTSLLKAVFATGNVVGWDIVELCPDGTRTAPFTAAKLLYKMINYHTLYSK